VTDAFADDPAIPDETRLWRRIPPISSALTFDSRTGLHLPSTANYNDSDDGSPMSVFIASDLSGPAEALSGYPDYFLVEFKAGDARSKGMGVMGDPKNDPPGHAYVVGKKTYGKRKHLRRSSRWIVAPVNAG
jgi:hypothetical protein